MDRITARGGTAVGVIVDVTRREDLRRLTDTAVERFGRLDVLVSDAGTMAVSPFDDLRQDDWDAWPYVGPRRARTAQLGERGAGIGRNERHGGGGGRQPEAPGDLLAQLRIDVRQDLQRPFLDRLLVALAQLEGVGGDDVFALRRRHAQPEQAGLGEGSENDAGDSRTLAASGTRTGVSVYAAVSEPARKGQPPSRLLGRWGAAPVCTALWCIPSRSMSLTGACGLLTGIWAKLGPPGRPWGEWLSGLRRLGQGRRHGARPARQVVPGGRARCL
ncbi:hypothetical protein ADK61_11725 [Streptomyces sp. XY66]|nr:hypothetical protein ADK61_11725 [Streptomyces sp. XY66]